MPWSLPGGQVKEAPDQQNFDSLANEGGSLEERVGTIEKSGVGPSGKAGGDLTGEYPNPTLAVKRATLAELENEIAAREAAVKTEKEARESGDSTEKSAREAAVKAEKEGRESADSTEKSARESADTTLKGEVKTEKEAREAADSERVKGPASSTESDIATYNGATGKVIKDSGKTIASVLAEAEEVARALANAAAAGLSVKNPVSYATTAALTVTEATEKTLKGEAPLTIDGTTPPPIGARLLVKNQAAEAQNGIYEVTTNEAFGGGGTFGGEGKFGEGKSWLLTRTSDADAESEVKQGMFVLVTLGSTNKSTTWILTTENPIVIGTTAQTFAAFTAQPIGPAGGDLKGTYPNPMILDEAIVNGDISSTAGIEYKKLSLTNKIVEGDLTENSVKAKQIEAGSVAGSELATITSSPAVFHPAFLGDLAGTFKPVLNTVYFAQVVVPFKFTLTGVAYRLATNAAGNIRSALYNAAGERVANKTANVAVAAGPNVTQGIAFDATYVAEPGVYFVALVFSTASPEVYNGTYFCPSNSVAGPGSGATATSITPPAITTAGNFVKMVAY